jgi:molybdate transport system substrate-binding protein
VSRRRHRFSAAFLGVLAATTLLVACDGGGEDATPAPAATSTSPLSGTLTVFAAASLTDAFTELQEAFNTKYPEVEIAFNFAGSSTLRTQLEQGAGADIFASANAEQMDLAQASGVVVEDDAVFVRNSLVVITPSDNPGGVSTLADMSKPDIKLVLATAEVPVGGYARQMLEKMDADPAYGAGFSEAVLANLVSNESNVKQAVAKVLLGEADFSIVYGTDVTPDVAADLATIEVPVPLNVIAEYPIALTSEAEDPEAARAFIDFILSAEGQAILEKWGFQTGA